MNNNQYNNHQNAFAKWMLAIVLLLSFFTFSAPVAQSPVKQEVHQTALVVNSPARRVKYINFNRVSLVSNLAVKTSVFATQSFLNLIKLHSGQANICLKNHSTPRLGGARGFLLSHIKTIHQKSSDDLIITLG